MDEEPMRRMTLRELQEAEILSLRGQAMRAQINDAAGLEALPNGALFQDKYGYVWQKNSVQAKDAGHGQPVAIYNLMGSPTIALAESVLNFNPLTVVATELPVEPRSRILPKGTVFPFGLLEALGISPEEHAATELEKR
jgi:hypothetical protein